mgnify:FL=1
MIDHLNLTRLWQLILNDIKFNANRIRLVAFTLILAFMLWDFYQPDVTAEFLAIFYIGGLIVTSLAFNNLHRSESAALYLNLPASNLEKFLSRWLLTSFVYAFTMLLVYYILSFMSAMLLEPSKNIIHSSVWHHVANYLLIQPLFLFGAIAFKRYAFLKTILSMFTCVIILMIAVLLMMWLLADLQIFDRMISYGPQITQIPRTLKFWASLFEIVLSSLFLYLTYQRLANYQLR